MSLQPVPQFTAPSYGDEIINNGTGSQDYLGLCSNLFPVKNGGDWVLRSTPGYADTQTVNGTKAFRGAYYSTTGQLFCVCGDTFYEITSLTGATSRGTIANVGNPAYMADNGTTLVVVDGSGSSYTVGLASGAPSLIVDANMPTTKHIAYQDGYFIVPKAGTGEFYLSNLLSGSTWTPAAFATAESKGDDLTAIYSDGSNLQLIGIQSTEVWYNTGNSSFPFERINGSVKPIGCENVACTASLDGVVYFLGSGINGGGSIWSVQGTTISKISTPAIEAMIVPSAATSAYCFCYKFQGYSFFQIYNTNNRVFVYNITNGTWFEKSGLGETPDKLRFVVNTLKDYFAADAVGFYTGSVAYLVNISDIYNSENTASTAQIVRRRIFGPIESNSKKLFHYQIRFIADILYDTGFEASSISAVLDWSDDGINYSASRTLTATTAATTIGQRVLWLANRLGSSASRYYRLTLTGPAAKIILKKCELDAKEGRF